MKNRLEVAKEFLRDDGFIAVAIDHFELFYLGALTDEIFGRDNRIGIVSVLHNPEGRQNAAYYTSTNEFYLMYVKSKKSKFLPALLSENIKEPKDLEEIYPFSDHIGRYKEESFIRLGGGDACKKENKPKGWYPIFVHPKKLDITIDKKFGYEEIYPITDSGQERTWKIVKKSAKEKIETGEIYAKKIKDKTQIYEKYRESKGTFITTVWRNNKYNAKKHGTDLLKKILGYKPKFSYPKSLYTVLDILKITTEKDDIILDFFAGSGTTGHATLALNSEDGGSRTFVLIDQLEEHIKIAKERMKKVLKKEKMEKDFIFCELAKFNETTIDEIKVSESSDRLFEIWEKIVERYFLKFDVEIKRFNSNQENFKKLSLKEQKKVIFEILNKNQLYVNFSEIDDEQFKVSKEDKELNKKFHGR